MQKANYEPINYDARSKAWFEREVGTFSQADGVQLADASDRMNRRFDHDCESCTFLGQWKEYDLYFCTQGGSMPTVIARFSSEGQDYTSGIHSMNPCLIVAQARATRMGLIADRPVYANLEEARVASMEHESDFWRSQCAEKSNEIVRLKDENQKLRNLSDEYEFESRLWLVAVMGLAAIGVVMTILWVNKP